MALSPGTRLGAYEITAAIGAGGMGEVFRARDTKLNRDVAIKVLPAAFADDPERLARFTREAQTLASLNHPNIATIYGIEEVGAAEGAGPASRALVMELVEGEDLSVPIARGPLPVAEAIPIARQIAEALEAAHELGVVHRDLKPANIKLRSDGTVKVLDFGLAKAMDGAGSSASNPNVSHSPTLAYTGTQAGIILGTAAYMSPEQAKGKAVDRRADIWAFGVVLYEMLTGQRAFKGDDVSETLASVLKDTLPMDALPAETPAPLKRLIGRCLDRDLKTRLRDIGEARVKLARIEAGGPESAASAPASAAEVKVPLWRRALPWATLAALSSAALLASLLMWAPWRRTPGPAPRTLLASIGADASLRTDRGASAILSPDGRTLAFTARQAGKTVLFVRNLDQLQAAALAGTEDAAYPFFSPDGHWIAFFAGGRLKKVSVTGGAPLNLCDAPSGRGGAWTDDDTIVFAPASAPNTRLMRVSASGGASSAFATFGEGGVTQRWPQALPGDKGLLFTEHSATANFDPANLVIAPLSGGTPKVVVRGGYYGRYVPSGHLLYVQQGTLFAAAFDLDRLETIGQAVPALEGVAADPGAGGAQVAFSADGTLVYVPGEAAAAAQPIDWMTRDGKVSTLRAERAAWANPVFSPDGQRLALDISDGKQRDIWIYEWARDTLTQLTFESGNDGRPVWTPDGRRIVFSSDRAEPGTNNLYWANADGTGEVTRLTESPESQFAFSWHPGGRFLAFVANRGATSWDLMILPMEGDASQGLTPGKATVFLGPPGTQVYPMFSPDGRWIAYMSFEAGNADVYVRPFPGPGGQWRISTGGGSFPLWSATARELLFLSQGKVMFAPYSVVGDSFRADAPRPWSPTGLRGIGVSYPYDLHPDGKRLALIAAPEQSDALAQDKVVFFFGFGEHLKKIAPGTR
jgi:serine/threonine-protein kinase